MSWSPFARPAGRHTVLRPSGPASRHRTRWRETLETLAFALVVGLVWVVVPVQAST